MMYNTLVIPSLELKQLRELLESPTYQSLKDRFPGLAAAVQAPLPDIKPVLKAALGAHAMQTLRDAQRPEPRVAATAAEAALVDARTLYAALSTHLDRVDSACHVHNRMESCDTVAGVRA